MSAPLLDHEVLKLSNSNYMELLVTTLQHFNKISTENYSDIFNKSDSSVHMEASTEAKAQFKFKSDNILSCSGTFSFKKGKLDSFNYNIKPQGYFKKRVCKKQYQRIVAMLTKISEAEEAKVENETDTMTKFFFNNGKLTVNSGQNMFTGTQMITVTFEK